MIEDGNGRFDDYSISPKSRQTLLDWAMNQSKIICQNLRFCFYKNELLKTN